MANTSGFNDWYKETTLKKGNECSRILAQLTAPSLENHPDVKFVKSGMNHIAVLMPRKDHVYYAFSVAGDPLEKDMQMYVKKLIERGVNSSLALGLTPLGFADVIDTSRSDPELARLIGNVMAEECHKYEKKFNHGFGVFNGEYADLGDRVTVDANMNITMICCVEDKDWSKFDKNRLFKHLGSNNIIGFIPGDDNLIYTNSDGVGTKHILYDILDLLRSDMSRNYSGDLAVYDNHGMQLDDLVKLNARAIITSNTLEHNGMLTYEQGLAFQSRAASIMSEFNGIGMINIHDVGDRLRPYKPGMSACNLSGSAVSLISKKNLDHLPTPVEGNYLVALRKAASNVKELPSRDGPRSNGISLLRRIPKDAFGEDWYLTPEGREILEFATTPSDIFYPLFKEVLDEGVATSVFHLSGGAYNEKLARPLTKEGLHVKLDNLWPVSDIVRKVIEISGMPPSSFYNKWVMSNPGFISTDYPATVSDVARKHGYVMRVVGRLEKSDKPGVSLKAYTGEDIYFDGN